MVHEILRGAGFILSETYKETRFITPPKSTYAIFFDSFEKGGADKKALTKHHSITIELYEYNSDPDAEQRIEEQLDSHFEYMTDSWKKQDRYYLEDEGLYQTVYEFEYIEK